MALPFSTLSEAFARTRLFAEKSWRLSPEAFGLSPEQVTAIEEIGQACLAFHRALETLYLRSAEERSLLRNGVLKAPWVAQWLDRGKPDWLIAHGREKALRGKMPAVLRPDLLLTEKGFALTELDSVPGGVGATGFLGELYGTDAPIVGGADGMLTGFARIAQDLGAGGAPVAVTVSAEAAGYRPEFEWLAARLAASGEPAVRVCRAEDLRPGPNGGCAVFSAEGHAPVGGIYRFFELFDLPYLGARDVLLRESAEGRLRLSPPMRAFQEEKLALALFHHPALQPFWKEQLPPKLHARLKAVIPETWVVEPAQALPPHLCLWGPTVDGQPLTDWAQLARARQKERDLVLKISGFHETAWGSRSVTLGADVPQTQWADALEAALKEAPNHPFILQRYEKPARVSHPLYDAAGAAQDFAGRVRLCPYYFVEDDHTRLGGVLATLCPADKKIIHGMSVAALLPCRYV